MRQRSARGGHVSRRVDQRVHGRKHQVPKNDGENVQTNCHCTARGVGIVESATGIHETTADRRGRAPAGKVLFVGAKRLPNAARAPTCHGGVSTAMVLFGGLRYRCLLVRPVRFVVLACVYPNGCCFLTPISFLCFFSLVVDCTTTALLIAPPWYHIVTAITI